MNASDLDRLGTKFLVGDECWMWTASTTGAGYGGFRLDGKLQKAHRVLYELMVGPIPEGLELDHLCSEKLCVRPDHLEPVTHRENTLRSDGMASRNAKKTQCPRGHPYDEANTYLNRDGRRECRTCNKAKQSAAYQKAKAQGRFPRKQLTAEQRSENKRRAAFARWHKEETDEQH